jgi:hypothetical protein
VQYCRVAGTRDVHQIPSKRPYAPEELIMASANQVAAKTLRSMEAIARAGTTFDP